MAQARWGMFGPVRCLAGSLGLHSHRSSQDTESRCRGPELLGDSAAGRRGRKGSALGIPSVPSIVLGLCLGR